MRRATSFRTRIIAIALAASCALAPVLPVSAETSEQIAQEAAQEVQFEEEIAAESKIEEVIAPEARAEEMLAEQDTIDAAVEVAERYEMIIAAAGEFAETDLEGVAQLAEYANETRELYESLDPEMQDQLAESTTSFENACVSIERMQEMLTQVENGETITTSADDCENSWRYNNGELIADALETVEEETDALLGNETDGAVPTANVAMVRSGSQTQFMRLAEPNAVKNVATASSEVYLGIDVSQWQGQIDWNAVKKAGIKFAILRVGRVLGGTWKIDSCFERNAAECERLGIPYGTYTYSYAATLSDIDNEANKTIQAVRGHKISLPVFTDMEDDKQIAAEKKTPGILNQFADRFTKKVAAAGYATGLYASSAWLDSYCLSFARNTNHYIWIARYNSSLSGPNADNKYSYKGPYCAWQYSSKGAVSGIKGNVDMNRWYGPLKTSSLGAAAEPITVDGIIYKIKENEITYAETGEKLSGVNGVRILDKDSDYYSADTIYYSRDGVIGVKYSGMAQDEITGRWRYYTDGMVDTGFVGLAHGNRWYYIRNGTVNYDFIGIVKSPKNGKLYAVTNGIIDEDTTGIAKYPADGKWYFVRKAQVDTTFTGIAKSLFDGKWYFVRKGKLDWKFTGIAKSVANGKWYFVRKGKLDWNFTGIAKSVKDGKWYFARKGQVDWSFTGVAKSVANGKWYYVRKGKLNEKYTGLAKSVSNGKWYYVRKGRLDWKYSGRVKYNKKWYRVKKGRVV